MTSHSPCVGWPACNILRAGWIAESVSNQLQEVRP